MLAPEEFAANLPPSRDDEPASLRQDIIDELADHLLCALQREQFSASAGALQRDSAGSSEAAARDRVLLRFGNPVTLTRRLWWDAMQEKIVSQRILAAASILAASAALVVCGLAWQAFGSLRDHQTAVLAQQQAANERIVAQLTSLIDRQQAAHGDLLAALAARPAATSGTDASWQHLRIRLVNDEGTPQRVSVWVHGTAMAGGELSESVETNPQGVADFGQLPPGEYRASYYLNDLGLSSSTKFLLGPGRPADLDILCPSRPPAAFDLKFVIAPPDDLRDVAFYYLADVSFHDYQFQGDDWSFVSGSAEEPVLLLGADGTILGRTTYESVPVREQLSSSTASISFLERLDSDFSFEPAEPLPSYRFNFQLWPYVADPPASAPSESRPALTRLWGAALRTPNPTTPVPGEECVVTIDDSYTGFWNDVRQDLARIDRYQDPDVPASTEAP
jgi:hypothetical protein